MVRTRLSGGRALAGTEMQTVGSAPAGPTVMLGAAVLAQIPAWLDRVTRPGTQPSGIRPSYAAEPAPE